MNRRRALKIGAIVLGVTLGLTLVLYASVGFIVSAVLEDAGLAWKRMERDGLGWRLRGITHPFGSAATARIELGTTPRLALRNATVDLAALNAAGGIGTQLAKIPDWAYVSADPLTLTWGQTSIASGLRTRLNRAHLVATGPTLQFRGPVREAHTKLDVNGTLSFGWLTVDAAVEWQLPTGPGEGRVEGTIEKLRIESDTLGKTALELADIQLMVEGTLADAAGALTMDGLEAKLELACKTPDAASCSAEIGTEEAPLAAFAKPLAALSKAAARAKMKGTFSARLSVATTPPGATLRVVGTAAKVTGSGVDVDRLRGFFDFAGTAADGAKMSVEGGPESLAWIGRDDLPPTVHAAVGAGLTLATNSDLELAMAGLPVRLAGGETPAEAMAIADAFAALVFPSGAEHPLERRIESWLRAAELASRLEPERLADLYINAAHWGPGVYGVDAASQYYFEVPAKELTANQSAFLGAILPYSAERHERWYMSGKPDRKRIGAVLDAMRERGAIDADALAEAKSAPFSFEN